MRASLAAMGSVVGVLSLAGVGWGKESPDLPKGEKAALVAEDGTALVGTWWAAGDAKGPAVILLPAAGADRASLLPLVRELLDRRLAVLSLDLRGHGERARQKSGDLTAPARDGDPAVLKATALDVLAAARWLAKAKGRDAANVGALAVGRSLLVALDAAGRAPGVLRAIAGISPEAKPAGLDGATLAQTVPPATAVLLVTHQEDAALGAEALATALAASRKARPDAAFLRLRTLDTPRPKEGAEESGYFHGVAMLPRVPLLSAYVGAFLARELGVAPKEALLDGEIGEESDPAKGGAWTHATPVPTEGGSASAYRGDRRVVFGGTMGAGQKYLEIKIRAYAPGVNWKELEEGVINVRQHGKYVMASVLLEAPDAHVRTAMSSWHDPLEGDDAKEGKDPGGPPGMPELPPGVPRPPGGFGFGGPPNLETPFKVLFRPVDGTFTFEGQIVLPVVKGAKVPKVDLQIGWTDQLPGMPTSIPLGPLPPMDLSGTWTEVPAR